MKLLFKPDFSTIEEACKTLAPIQFIVAWQLIWLSTSNLFTGIFLDTVIMYPIMISDDKLSIYFEWGEIRTLYLWWFYCHPFQSENDRKWSLVYSKRIHFELKLLFKPDFSIIEEACKTLAPITDSCMAVDLTLDI